MNNKRKKNKIKERNQIQKKKKKEIKGRLEQQMSESFICREEKGKVTWGHAAGPGNK
jgi:hypothetical protein